MEVTRTLDGSRSNFRDAFGEPTIGRSSRGTRNDGPHRVIGVRRNAKRGYWWPGFLLPNARLRVLRKS